MRDSLKSKILHNTALFKDLSPAKLLELARLARVLTLKKDEVLFLLGEPALRLFVIASGAVRAFRVNASGREQVIHVEKAGATLAEVAIFDDGPYPATAAAEEETVLLCLDRALLKEFCFRHPEVAWAALTIMAGRLRRHAGLIDQLALQDVVPRLAQLLLDEAIEKAVVIEDGATLTLPFSQQQLAARIGSVREVVSRSLSRLEKGGVITMAARRSGSKGTSMVVLNANALKTYAQAAR